MITKADTYNETVAYQLKGGADMDFEETAKIFNRISRCAKALTS